MKNIRLTLETILIGIPTTIGVVLVVLVTAFISLVVLYDKYIIVAVIVLLGLIALYGIISGNHTFEL